MTLLWFDGFETYSTSAQAVRIPELVNSNITDTTAGNGRRSTRSLRLDSSSAYYRITPQNDVTNNTTIIIGIAMWRDHTGDWYYNSSYPIFGLYDTSGGNMHVGIYPKNATHVMEIRDGATATVRDTGTYVIPYQTWCYFELKVVIADSGGSVETKFDGTVDMSWTSADTKNGANGYVGMIRMMPPHQYNIVYYDDLYVLNGQGSVNNDYLGDIRVDVVRPNEAGAHTDFTPSTGSNYENVDEIAPDDDTTYNESVNTAAGDQDTYGMEALEVIGATIHGVKDQITIRKTDSGAREAKIITRQSGTDYLSATITTSDTYTSHTRVMEVNPDDSAAFVESDVNSGEVGVEVVS